MARADGHKCSPWLFTLLLTVTILHHVSPTRDLIPCSDNSSTVEMVDNASSAEVTIAVDRADPGPTLRHLRLVSQETLNNVTGLVDNYTLRRQHADVQEALLRAQMRDIDLPDVTIDTEELRQLSQQRQYSLRRMFEVVAQIRAIFQTVKEQEQRNEASSRHNYSETFQRVVNKLDAILCHLHQMLRHQSPRASQSQRIPVYSQRHHRYHRDIQILRNLQNVLKFVINMTTLMERTR